MKTVFLVHGFKDTGAKLERMARHLRTFGWTAHALTVSPSGGQLGIEELAAQLAAFIERNPPAGQKFSLVGFSMGGLICRYYLQRLGGLERVERFVSIASPHRGTWMAYLGFNRGCRQMRPGSEFLQDLNSDVFRLAQIHFTSVWTPLDLMIIPAISSRVGIGRERLIWSAAHPLMVHENRCIRAVAELLNEELGIQPASQGRP